MSFYVQQLWYATPWLTDRRVRFEHPAWLAQLRRSQLNETAKYQDNLDEVGIDDDFVVDFGVAVGGRVPFPDHL